MPQQDLTVCSVARGLFLEGSEVRLACPEHTQEKLNTSTSSHRIAEWEATFFVIF